ncbi:hypothetical protein KO498_11545 [Lentibacter algarum]|uniref:calcium-binding protein n=1 Tax=Lentibacter algarum TaxID=576131 RepID=UPI001C0918AB|nr:hypothetical protein [Lentibacter algarum]MBU2982443.1 hypothetical protein [Lentibacter algarum]
MAVFAIAMLMGVALVSLIPDFDYDGTDASEKYTGTPEDDSFDGGGGNDLIIGYEGDDTLSGSQGDDWLIGHDGNDDLSGGDGDDVIIGGAGVDNIHAGSGNDFVEAANIADQDALQSSIDEASGFADINFDYDLPGQSDEGDTITLGEGDDTAVIGSNDTLTSGAGADEITLGDWITVGSPASITDFDPQEDMLLFSHDSNTPEPEISLHHDETTNTTEVRADNAVIATLDNPISEVSLSNIRVNSYA